MPRATAPAAIPMGALLTLALAGATAHALWHVATVPFGFLFYDFVAGDAAYEAAAAAKRGATPEAGAAVR